MNINVRRITIPGDLKVTPSQLRSIRNMQRKNATKDTIREGCLALWGALVHDKFGPQIKKDTKLA